MSKQIEEMAKILCKPTANKGNCEKCGFKRSCSKFDDATDLYNVGYRKQNEWIPVTERLPEESCRCISVNKAGIMFMMPYSSRYKAFNATDDDEGDERKMSDITHWMPLPEPPESEV